MRLFENECRPAKNDPAVRAQAFISSPSQSSSRDPKKNYPQPTQNAPYESSVVDPGKGSTPRTSNRPHVSDLKNTHLKPSCHRTGTTTATHPQPLV